MRKAELYEENLNHTMCIKNSENTELRISLLVPIIWFS